MLYKLSKDQSVAVATDYYWNFDMAECPRGVKVQLLGAGGVAVYGNYDGSDFWVAWAPLPRIKGVPGPELGVKLLPKKFDWRPVWCMLGTYGIAALAAWVITLTRGV